MAGERVNANIKMDSQIVVDNVIPYHQPSEANYIEAFAQVDFPCRRNSGSWVCRGYQLLGEGGSSSLQVVGGPALCL